MASGIVSGFFTKILIISLWASPTYPARKYDIESECLKLYQEDLPTVLQRFRRSPEYLKILDQKVKELETFTEDVSNQVTYFYVNQLNKKIGEMLGVNTDKSEEKGTTTESSHDHDSDNQLLRNARRFPKWLTGESENISGVERLDSYSKLSSSLTLAQRNSMKDLGFQYAGHMIHAIIRNMAVDQSEKGGGKFTKYDLPELKKTTEHVSVHIVSSTLASEIKTKPAVESVEKTGENDEEENQPSKKSMRDNSLMPDVVDKPKIANNFNSTTNKSTTEEKPARRYAFY